MFSSKKSFIAHFQCRECGHEFRRNLPRVYVHKPDFDRQITKKQPGGRSPFIVPQHVSCPQCNVMDECELAPQTVKSLTVTVIVNSMMGLVKDHPVKIISFGLYDGTLMHPLDAVEHYRAMLERAPDDLATRMRYANVMRTVGWLDEAKEQYEIILAADLQKLEAWLGLVSVHVGYNHTREAKKTLLKLYEHANRSTDPNAWEYAEQTQAYLEGAYPLSDLTPDSLFLNNPTQPERGKKK